MRRLNLPFLGMLAAVVLLWAWVFSAFAEGIAGPVGPDLGDLVTYTDAAGGAWCAHVGAIVPDGVGGVPWAWVTIDVDQRRAMRVPVSLLRAGCPL